VKFHFCYHHLTIEFLFSEDSLQSNSNLFRIPFSLIKSVCIIFLQQVSVVLAFQPVLPRALKSSYVLSPLIPIAFSKQVAYASLPQLTCYFTFLHSSSSFLVIQFSVARPSMLVQFNFSPWLNQATAISWLSPFPLQESSSSVTALPLRQVSFTPWVFLLLAVRLLTFK
jgi:hypothetical protein